MSDDAPSDDEAGSDGCGADLTQEGLRELSGVDRTTVRRIEAGTTDARLSRLLRVASALGVPLTDLVRVSPGRRRGRHGRPGRSSGWIGAAFAVARAHRRAAGPGPRGRRAYPARISASIVLLLLSDFSGDPPPGCGRHALEWTPCVAARPGRGVMGGRSSLRCRCLR
ncbi:helix-turn-helix transcriptional regulator [Streptomyces smyrnaeus]|uniref:helix-turn-helix transcriptional regulator n=1 Tax=Streptomyces smyrnaeus TaxID=1387713 RepID=UPI0037B4649B